MPLIGLVVVCLAGVVLLEHRTLQEQQHQIDSIIANADSGSRAAAYDLQEKCAQQAAEAFKSQQANERRYGSQSAMPGYTNHYNARLNRCFIAITESSGQPFSISKSIMDVQESKSYAMYADSNPQGRTYSNVKPTFCEVWLPSGEKKTCSSAAEFDELVKVYEEK